MTYELTLLDATSEIVDADGYAQEGPLTTFFAVDAGRFARLDAWSTRLLSVRTDRIARVRRVAPATGPGAGAELAAA